MTDLEKQLIVLSAFGIYITHQDGHRWIESAQLENYNYSEELSKHGILVNNKIYGGVKEAIKVIDETWKMMYDRTLTDEFDSTYDVNDDIEYIWGHKRIDMTTEGHGGLV